jgi:hypothetical protein
MFAYLKPVLQNGRIILQKFCKNTESFVKITKPVPPITETKQFL